MFRKILASVGIGAAKVDTVLHTEHLYPGQNFSGEILIEGGDVEQDISGLDLALMTKVKVETEDDGVQYQNFCIDNWHLSDSFTLQPGEKRALPFEATLPSETPVTELPTSKNKCVVWIQTGLNIDMAIDASDKDYLYVYPNDVIQAFMAAMEEFGYSMAKADVEKGYLNAGSFNSSSGCYQELEYRPGGFTLFGIKEVEFSFVPEVHQTHVLIELDRAFTGDGYKAMTIPHHPDELASIEARLKDLLS
ncbi:sporulation protein [Veronia pacifica]|uniref:Sporulation control protein Spo0M n=1 Tax=Veronia pacifica TaxID=1080227 RepID=A0A1C3EPU0_9GAMM|nr:sporulation protein [Veronia pacifica]ODA35268.1 sporulation control protein Spo0M [Veronia pacifica]